MAMHAIPTVYRGIEYRSRLEARWAAFFTEIGWRHTYEPFDGNGYIPDFLIEGGCPLLVEIKPATLLADYHDPVPKIERGLRGHWQNDVLILGINPLPQGFDTSYAADPKFPPAGGYSASSATTGPPAGTTARRSGRSRDGRGTPAAGSPAKSVVASMSTTSYMTGGAAPAGTTTATTCSAPSAPARSINTGRTPATTSSGMASQRFAKENALLRELGLR
jgi:hypothetical protein